MIDTLGMYVKSRQFRNHHSLWKAYALMKSPENNCLEFRNGKKIFLSGNPHDIITVMVIFCRNEYGRILKGSTVIDIGANIGAFSLYAAMNGASRVYAYEPNLEAYNIIQENIKQNSLESVIYAYNRAVAATDNEVMKFPRSASPYNRAIQNGSLPDSEYDDVETISLKSIFNSVDSGHVDLCKIDCEGAEYEILYSTPDTVLAKIDHLRLEHHDGSRKSELVYFLSRNGFVKTRDKNILMWFESNRVKRPTA